MDDESLVSPGASQLNDDLESKIKDVQAKVETIRLEVDGLQILATSQLLATSQRKNWFQDNVATVIAVLAFVVSLVTTVASYQRTKAQDVLNSHLELRHVLQRLSVIPRENAEASARLQTDPRTLAYVGSSYNQENASLVQEATELVTSLPKNTVSAAEYYDLGSALENSFDYSRAKEYFRKAADSATDLNIAVAALRKSADMEFATGQPQSGRALYEKALDIFRVYPTSNDLLIKSTNVYTELAWAEAEGTSGNLTGFSQHVSNARQLVNSLPYTPAGKMLSAMVESQEKLFSNPAASPTVPAPSVVPH